MFQINEDVLRFLNGHLGNNDSAAFVRCSDFAYRDMCRTIRFSPKYNEKSAKSSAEKGEISQNKRELRAQVTDIIKTQIEKWLNAPSLNETQFNEEHKELCETIIEKYRGTTAQGEKDNSLYFGQAQKWVNMTLKNLYIYSESNHTQLSLTPVLEYLHIPIDNVILDIVTGVKKCYVDSPTIQYGVAKPKVAWSKWDYDTYCQYQGELKAAIQKQYPNTISILWELTHWSTVSSENYE